MKTVLVIEDNEDNMKLITFILEKNGYKVLGAEAGQQGVDVALEARPDFIILDIQLPDMYGLEVLKKIRNSEIDSGVIPVIAMASYDMVGGREKMMAAGCNGYIEKPIDPEKVMSQIREIIGEKS